MGTELQYDLNLFHTLPKEHGDRITIEAAEFPTCSSERSLKGNFQTGFIRIQESMEKMAEKYIRESMKKTMLKQEEIFKQQVRELHYLYRVHETLMTEARNELKHRQLIVSPGREAQAKPGCLDMDAPPAFWSGSDGSPTHHFPFRSSHQNSTQLSSHYDVQTSLRLRTGEDSQEQNSCSTESFNVHRELDLEHPTEEHITTDINLTKDQEPTHRFTKCKMTATGLYRLLYFDDAESDIELSLSIGQNTEEKKHKCRSRFKFQMGCSESKHGKTRRLIPSVTGRSDQEKGCSGIASAGFEIDPMRHPPWLLQSMGLNKT